MNAVYSEIDSNRKAKGAVTNDMQYSMVLPEQKMQAVRQNYHDVMQAMLELYGGVRLEDDSPDMLSSDAGQMQTSSDVMYFSSTKEFCYIASFSAKTFLNDMWGDYDLVSMEMKDNNGWYWNDISVAAYFNNYKMTESSRIEMGMANKYEIISGSKVSARTDFWNGCIFNVRDQKTGNAIMGNSYGLSDLLLVGWLQTKGSSRVNYVKADYEHNYRAWIWEKVAISTTNLKDFSLGVEYSSEGRRWLRSTGSKRIEIPS